MSSNQSRNGQPRDLARPIVPTRTYADPALPVLYRPGQALDAPSARFLGYAPGQFLLKKGSVRRPRALPLPCDIFFERDVPVRMRDGVTTYTNIFRPVGDATGPAIIAWSPYGKDLGGQWLDDLPGRVGVPLEAVSELQKWEGADPAYWVDHGYVIVNPDIRGAYFSEGNISFLGRQTAEDGYDLVEWCAAQPWSNGHVTFSGNSWLGFAQWFIAAEQPPHLTCIAPWEGLTDLYRDVLARGGIPMPYFIDIILQSFASRNLVEDVAAMVVEHPEINSYWEDKIARLDRIHVPAYVAASYTNGLHVHGSFDGFRNIASSQKWLRVHNSQEWPDYYQSENVEDLRRFFDHFMKGVENGWPGTPRIRLTVLDPGPEPVNRDTIGRIETEFPLARTQYRKLYLQSQPPSFAQSQPTQPSQLSYNVGSGQDSSLIFDFRFEEETEITGYMNLHLSVEADGADEMDLAVTIVKLSAGGEPQTVSTSGGSSFDAIQVKGFLRVSQRALDSSRSTISEPYLTFREAQPLNPGEVVPVQIGLWPTSLRFHPGESLRLTIEAYEAFAFPIQFGAVPVPIVSDGVTVDPSPDISVRYLGGSSDPAAASHAVSIPQSKNRGRHIFHFGGKRDSFLLIPVIPPR